MRRLLYCLFFLAATAGMALADDITFSFIIGNPGSLAASASGLTMGPAKNVLVSDTTKGLEFFLSGTFTGSTGPASSFSISPPLVSANYTAGGVNSVAINTSTMALVRGTMDSAVFLSSFPNGTGSFLGKFTVTAVNPLVLSLFGLGPGFSDDGSVSATFAGDQLVGSAINGTLGGGTVTIQTPVPEPARMGLWVMGLLIGMVLAGRVRRSV